RALRQVLVRAVNRVPGLESDDAFPAPLGEEPAGVGRVERELGMGRRGPLEDGYAAREVERVLRVQPRDARMVGVGRPEAAFGLALPVVGVDVLDLQYGEEPPVLVG